MSKRGYFSNFYHRYSTVHPATLNHLIKNSLQNGQLKQAFQIFDENPTSRNIVSWNNWLSALQNNQDQLSTYNSYLHLQRTGLYPTTYTFSIVITSVLGTDFRVLIPQLHAQIIKLGHCSSIYVGSALMRGYTNLKDHTCLFRVFTDMLDKDISLWNALLLGYMELGLTVEAQKVFEMMPEKDVISWTTMIDGYLRNKEVKRARYVFDEMGERNVISWTAMINGYVGINKCMDAIELFVKMMRTGPSPNQHTFASILAACAKQSELGAGQQVHGCVMKHGITIDVVLASALVNMYAKCGDSEAAYCIFEKMP